MIAKHAVPSTRALYVARGPWAFYQGSRDAQSEGEGDEKDCFRSRSNGFGDAVGGAGTRAAEYTTIILEKTVNRTPDQTWAKIGPYCAIATWLKVPA